MGAGREIWEALFAWLHLLAAGVAFGLLLSEYWLSRRLPDRAQLRLLGLVDLGHFLALAAVLATGLARTLYFGKGAAFYLANHLFWLKISVFVLLWLIAVFPTGQVIRWVREARAVPVFAPLGREVERFRGCVALQIGLWVLLPLLAVLIARGFAF